MEEMRIEVPTSEPNNLNQLNKVAVKLDENLYGRAATKSDYRSRICQKMMPTECNPSSAAASSNSGLTQPTMTDVDHNASLQSGSSYSCDSIGNPVGQGMRSSIFVNTNRELPRSQPLQQMVSQPRQHEPLRHQLLKQKFQQPNIQPSLTQSNIQYSHRHQDQQHISSLPAELQSSQQPMFTTVQGRRLTGKLPNATILQQSQQLGLQKNVLEKQQQQLPLYQQNMSTSCQQPLGIQRDVQQQQMVRPQSELKMWTHQNPLHILPQPEVSAAQQKLQKTSQPIQLHQLLDSQKHSNPLQEGMQQRIQTLVASHHPQSVIIDEQKQLHQSQRVLPDSSSASVDSTAQTEHASLADWHDKAYQQLLSTREMYLPEVIKLYKRAHELCRKPPNPESATKYEKTRIFVEKMLKFLQLPRADMVHCSKEKFNDYLKLIIWYLNSVQSKNLVSMQHHGQHQPPGGQSQIFQLQQKGSMKVQFHSVNPGSTSTLSGSPQFSMHQGITNSQPNMINSFQIGSLARSEQRLSKFISNSQKLKQPMQQQMVEQKEQQMLIQKMFEANGSKGRQVMGFSSGRLQQRHSIGKQTGYSPQPQVPQVDQINLFSPLSKCGTPLQSATSPFTVPSHSTFLTPSSIPVDIEKHSFGVSPVSIAENMEHLETPVVLAQQVFEGAPYFL
uniref:Putative mediator of RNA polymerase II transcription subunit 15a-like n=1 Tax=Davidia involucrata TaxID=16924 RepID=A0A5B6YZ18_DAVIN